MPANLIPAVVCQTGDNPIAFVELQVTKIQEEAWPFLRPSLSRIAQVCTYSTDISPEGGPETLPF